MEYGEQFENNSLQSAIGIACDSKEYAENILQSLVDLVVVLDSNFAPVAANNAFLLACGIESDQLKKSKNLFELADRLWDLPELRKTIMPLHDTPMAVESEFKMDLPRLGGKTLLMNAVPLQPQSQYPGYIVISLRDITERKKMEDERHATESSEALVELANGVSHTFNNLLQVVVGGIELAKMELDSGEVNGLGGLFRKILERSLLGADIVKNLGDFVRRHRDDMKSSMSIFDLSRTVIQALEITRSGLKGVDEAERRKTSVSLELEQGCLLAGKEKEILEVVVSLLTNAFEAMPEGGEVKLQTSTDGEEIVLVAQDQGIGIAPEHISKVFLPLWSSKSFRSHGMGLAKAHATITKHGGNISVESVEGVGSTFVCRLPRARPTHSLGSAEGGVSQRSFRILVIDDQPAIVSLLETALTMYEQTVFTASSGREGLEKFQEIDVDIVVCDLSMNDMNGWQVGNAMKRYCERKSRPKVPFILFTGHSGLENQKNLIEESGVDRIVQKPIRPADLLGIIEEVAGNTSKLARTRGSNEGMPHSESTLLGVNCPVPTTVPQFTEQGLASCWNAEAKDISP